MAETSAQVAVKAIPQDRIINSSKPKWWVLGVILVLLFGIFGYYYSQSRVCRVEVSSVEGMGELSVRNSLSWQLYVSSISKCRGGQFVVYVPDTAKRVLVDKVDFVLAEQFTRIQYTGESKNGAYIYDVYVDEEGSQASVYISVPTYGEFTQDQMESVIYDGFSTYGPQLFGGIGVRNRGLLSGMFNDWRSLGLEYRR